MPPDDARCVPTAVTGLAGAAAGAIPIAGAGASELSAAGADGVVANSSAAAGNDATNTASTKTHSKFTQVTLIRRPSAPCTLDQQRNRNRLPGPSVGGAGAAATSKHR